MSHKLLTAALLGLLITACQPESPAPSAADDAMEEASVADTPAAAEEAPADLQQYSAEEFYATTSYAMANSAGVAFEPESGNLLISSDDTGVFNAYRLPVDGSAAVALTTSDDDAIFGISWFPKDSRLLYAQDDGGNELDHIWVRETDGTLRDLTPGDPVKASFLRWSDEGAHFWLMTNERDQRNFDVYRYAIDDYSRELIFTNDGYSIADISPNGRWLALNKSRTSADSDIYLVDLEADQPEPQLITEHDGNIAYSVYTITADSNTLLYATNENGEFVEAWAYNLESGEKELHTRAEWDVQFVIDSPSGRYQVTGINADARTLIDIIDTETGDELKLGELPAGDITSVRFNQAENQVAFLLDSDTSPRNVHVVDLRSGDRRQLTSALSPQINPDHLVQSEVIRYPSFDDLDIPGLLYKPHQANSDNPAPALVWVHGGPGGQSRQGYRAIIQHLVNHGYAIFAANNRGSSGYGKTFFHLDDKRHGEDDLQDIVYAKKYLQQLDWVDEERIGIIGGSYGGYMVAAALAFEPEVFDVGIDIFGVTNWVRTLTSIPPWWESFKEALYDEMGDPATDEERHRRISPLFHASNIQKPLLVIQGANDPRVLQVESDELVAAVRANDVPVEYVVFDDEGHGFLKKDNRIEAQKAYLAFLDQYLKNTDTE
ncbi:MAG: S9 family peptidase [Wenzhouxiangellaceae bacterium]